MSRPITKSGRKRPITLMARSASDNWRRAASAVDYRMRPIISKSGRRSRNDFYRTRPIMSWFLGPEAVDYRMCPIISRPGPKAEMCFIGRDR